MPPRNVLSKKGLKKVMISSLVLANSTVPIINAQPSKTAHAESITDTAADLANGDWSKQYITTTNTPEAEVMVRSGDIDNLGFGWPGGFNPFTGESTPVHSFPWNVDAGNADGTDRIMVGSSYKGDWNVYQDGYSTSTSRPTNDVQPIHLHFDPTNIAVHSAMLQLYVDDFQAADVGSRFQVTLNGERAPFIEDVLNSLNQTGPVGKLINVPIPGDYLYLLENGDITITIDDPTTAIGDGFAIDFAKLLVNPITLSETAAMKGKVVDAATGDPIIGAKISISGLTAQTDENGIYHLDEVPAGLGQITVSGENYTSSVETIELKKGEGIEKNFQLKIDPDAVTVSHAMEQLTNELISKGNPSLNNIENNLNLPTLIDEVNINWVSSHPDVIATNGTITRPASSAGDQSVHLTATLSKGAIKRTIEFDTVVKALPAPEGIDVGVTDTSTNLPISEAIVLIEFPDGTTQKKTTDNQGKVHLSLAEGDSANKLYIYKTGYLPEEIIPNGSSTPNLNVQLKPSNLVTSDVKVNRMTPAELIDAGVDINDPDNWYVYKFEVKLAFKGLPLPPEQYIVNNKGVLLDMPTGDYTYNEFGIKAIPMFIPYENHPEVAPTLAYLIIPGEARRLKEFFEVGLVITNNAAPPFAIEDAKVKLNLPEGLSLAPMQPTESPQILNADLGTIQGGQSVQHSWILRGDTKGDYDISADFSGDLTPFHETVTSTFKSDEPFHVWGEGAVQMIVDTQDEAHWGYPYHVRFGIKNVTDDPVYKLNFKLKEDGKLNYVYAPNQQLEQTIEELPAHQTVYFDYWLIPGITGKLDLSHSAVITTGGNEEIPAQIVEHSVPGDLPRVAPLLRQNYNEETGETTLNWSPVTGAIGYEVYRVHPDETMSDSGDLIGRFNSNQQSYTFTEPNGRQNYAIKTIMERDGIKLEKSGNITGSIATRFSSNSAVSPLGVKVELLDEKGISYGSAITDSTGKFVFTDIPAGNYWFYVADPVSFKVSAELSSVGQESQATEAALTAHGVSWYDSQRVGSTIGEQNKSNVSTLELLKLSHFVYSDLLYPSIDEAFQKVQEDVKDITDKENVPVSNVQDYEKFLVDFNNKSKWYQSQNFYSYARKYDTSLQPINAEDMKDWNIIDFEDGGADFQGAAFQNKNGEVVIAFRGTAQKEDIAVDAAMIAYADKLPHQVQPAREFVSRVLQKVVSGSNGKRVNITLTGHSLGGWLAQKMYLDLKEDISGNDSIFGISDLNQKIDLTGGATFNAPGFWEPTYARTGMQFLLDRINPLSLSKLGSAAILAIKNIGNVIGGDNYITNDQWKKLRAGEYNDLSNYIVDGDLVGGIFFSDHVGKTIELPYLGDSSSFGREHSISNFYLYDYMNGQIQQTERRYTSLGGPGEIFFGNRDWLDAGPGGGLLQGYNANDTYIYRYGYGTVTIEDGVYDIMSAGDNDTVIFDVKSTDVGFARQGDDLVIYLLNGMTILKKDPDQVIIRNMINPLKGRNYTVENFKFADGKTLSYQEVLQKANIKVNWEKQMAVSTDFGEGASVQVAAETVIPPNAIITMSAADNPVSSNYLKTEGPIVNVEMSGIDYNGAANVSLPVYSGDGDSPAIYKYNETTKAWEEQPTTISNGVADATVSTLSSTDLNILGVFSDQTPPVAPAVVTIKESDRVVTGTAQAGTTITIKAGNDTVGTAVTGTDGTFAVDIPAQQKGTVLVVTAKNSKGIESTASTVVVNATIALEAPAVNVVKTTDRTVTGTGPAGNTVIVEANNTTLGTATIGTDGKFSVDIPSQETGTVLFVKVKDADGNESTVKQVKVIPDECFIATAAFGSKFEPSVSTLREFRDEFLLPHPLGEKFVNFYYKNSPAVAEIIAKSEPLKWAVRQGLRPFVAATKAMLDKGKR